MPPQLILNQRVSAEADEAIDRLFPAQAVAEAAGAITNWAGYEPTPLVTLPGLAAGLGLAAIALKDESDRFGLGSFKALGGAYAVYCILRAHVTNRTGTVPTPANLESGSLAALTGEITVICATAGNHGRSVAWAAGRFGCRCVILVHAGVTEERRAAMARFGAEIREVPGSYDDSVREAAQLAAAHGWHLVPDTSTSEQDPIPALVMQGYTVMGAEIVDQWRGPPPTHVFVQVGVGGLAAGVAEALWRRWRDELGHIVCVEPEAADCFARSLAAGAPTPISGDLDTLMLCLACGEVSAPAWAVLRPLATAAMTISDDETFDAMRRLADPAAGDPPLAAGESGAAGLAGLIALCRDDDRRRRLGLGPTARVLAIVSEGALDRALYDRVVGRGSADAESVRSDRIRREWNRLVISKSMN
ncbi:diaminopropionate ammonia-lyase [Chelatococcus asaccharovorans]|uniref:Diaminopropionate ammonia-lyase n=1 Tax=Chelatococcus asaccharovorans TaxID=28210 RepID=A0A2V3UHY2_9HYPH|nr:diaminopropionate ammonia-lyase [Chelatococcus asaccharovorans]MBS7705680.1 diaminopropionate ammonia-lyase [Chelatococcus asaccharovorans]PXW58698.1 diaminopropionate ammonia-lyase [Chelatococcus asaccharovorans]